MSGVVTGSAPGADTSEAAAETEPSDRETPDAASPDGSGDGADVERPDDDHIPGGHHGLARLPALDGLRGLAVGAVLFFHAGHLPGGYLGVDLFFVLSGFLITRLLIEETDRTGKVSLGDFWFRRARRLLPALAVLLAGVAVYAAFAAQPDELSRIRGDAIATVAYVANWRAIFTNTDYWSLFATPSPLVHTWSLAIEEQFYLVWPLVALAMVGRGRARGVRNFAWLIIGLIVVSLLVSVWVVDPADTTRAYDGTDTRAASILVGALLSLVAARRPRWLEVGTLAPVAALVVLGVAWWAVADGEVWIHQGGLVALALVASVVIAGIVTQADGGPTTVLLSLPPLRHLGLWSYGLYLYHWPIFVWLNEERTGLDGWTLTLVRMTVSLVAAGISFHLIESPIRHQRVPGAASERRVALASSGLVAAGLIALVAVTWGAETSNTELAEGREVIEARRQAGEASNTETGGTDDESRSAADGQGDPTVTADGAEGADGATDDGVESDGASSAAEVTPTVMLLGDSVPSFLGEDLVGAPGLVAEVINRGQPACDLGRESVSARWGEVELGADDCLEWNDWFAEEVAAAPPSEVLIMPGPMATTDRTLANGQVLEVCSSEHISWYANELASAIGVVREAGSEAAMTNLPYFALYNNPVDIDARVDCINQAIEAATSLSGAPTIDLAGFLCPTSTCRTHMNGVELRPDGTHVTGPGARIVGRWLLEQTVAS